MRPRIVPELEVTDLVTSLTFYVERVGFVLSYARPEEGWSVCDRVATNC